IGVDVNFLVRESSKRTVQEVPVTEPVTAEDASHQVPAARVARFGARQRAETDVAVDVAVVEIACAERGAEVPRPLAIAGIRGAGRLAKLEPAVAAAEIGFVIRVSECASYE